MSSWKRVSFPKGMGHGFQEVRNLHFPFSLWFHTIISRARRHIFEEAFGSSASQRKCMNCTLSYCSFDEGVGLHSVLTWSSKWATTRRSWCIGSKTDTLINILFACLQDFIVSCDVVTGVLRVPKEELVGWAQTSDRSVIAVDEQLTSLFAILWSNYGSSQAPFPITNIMV